MPINRPLRSGFVLLLLVAGSSGFATAEEGPGRAGDKDRCAVYGSGFVAVEGTETCARIGGHIRVEIGTLGSRTLRSGFNRMETVDGPRPAAVTSGRNPAAMNDDGDSHMRTHLRVQGLPGSRDLFAR
ncbi:MAG: hypothetical protein NVSMB26_15480 [Beijerinckiaceae bacterium]